MAAAASLAEMLVSDSCSTLMNNHAAHVLEPDHRTQLVGSDAVHLPVRQ